MEDKTKFIVDVQLKPGTLVIESVSPRTLFLKCPLCPISTYPQILIDSDKVITRAYKSTYFKFDMLGVCSYCDNVLFIKAEYDYNSKLAYYSRIGKVVAVYPEAKNLEIPKGIPEKYHQDFLQAQRVLTISPNASALLCRRILQRIIRDEFVKADVVDKYKAKYKKYQNLNNEVEFFIDELNLIDPSLKDQLRERLDLIRLLGNIGAHPEYSTEESDSENSVNVDFEDAEYIVYLLGRFFHVLFVQPFKDKEMSQRINDKLKKSP